MLEKEIQVLDALINGVNYFTGEKCLNESILNDPEIIRSLYRISVFLRNAESEETKSTAPVPYKERKGKFVCPDDIYETFSYNNEMSLTSILKQVLETYPNVGKPSSQYIVNLLIQRGILEKVIYNGKYQTIATPIAREFGATNVERSMYGRTFKTVAYNPEGQKYILSILKEM